MEYLKSVTLGIFGGFIVIGLMPFLAIIIVFAGLAGQIKVNKGVKDENTNN